LKGSSVSGTTDTTETTLTSTTLTRPTITYPPPRPTITTSQNKDIDEDGLPDDWEISYFGKLDEGPDDDYDGDGKYWWNQAQTFEECRSDFEFTLAQQLIEENVFPVSFRSGWHFMDNAWQQRLDEILPFSMHNAYPQRKLTGSEPLANIIDWSRAPTSWVPYHPDPQDYQVPGPGHGWNGSPCRCHPGGEGCHRRGC